MLQHRRSSSSTDCHCSAPCCITFFLVWYFFFFFTQKDKRRNLNSMGLNFKIPVSCHHSSVSSFPSSQCFFAQIPPYSTTSSYPLPPPPFLLYLRLSSFTSFFLHTPSFLVPILYSRNFRGELTMTKVYNWQKKKYTDPLEANKSCNIVWEKLALFQTLCN